MAAVTGTVYYRDQPPLEFKNERIANENDFLLMDDFARALDTGSEPILNAQAGRDIGMCARIHIRIDSKRDLRQIGRAHV